MKSGMQGTTESERRAYALRELARAAEDPARTAATLARARAHFFGALAVRDDARATGIAPAYAMLVGFAASVAIVCVALLARRAFPVPAQRTGRVVSYAVEGAPGVIGAWHSAPATPLSLRFSEGTSLVLSANASLRVVRTDEHGATVALERGRLHARVEHREGTRWAVDAGPYHVRVTGTEFDVDWDPGTASFGIRLIAGSVQVTGCNAAGARVAGGEMLRLHCVSSGSSAVADGLAVEGVAEASERSAARAGKEAETVAEVHPDGEGGSAKAGPSSALTDLAKASELSRRRTAAPSAGSERREPQPAEPASPSPAVDEHPETEEAPEGEPQRAELASTPEHATSVHGRDACEPIAERARAALDIALESGTPDGTWAAIQCARRAGLSNDAERALRVFRERYGTDSRRATAAFLLGKLTFARGEFRTAGRWFDTSRREAPGGQLARESAGRMIESWQRAGDAAAAIRAAREYVAAYPEGPHASLARSLLAP